MADHYVQSVGNFSAVLVHPLVLDGVALNLRGFKLDSQFLDTVQLIENSKIISLVDGGTITLTNANKAGSITFNCSSTSGRVADGDVVAVGRFLRTQGDSVGGLLRIAYSIGGNVTVINFLAVTIKTTPPLKLAGNDIPDYAVEFNYADFEVEQ